MASDNRNGLREGALGFVSSRVHEGVCQERKKGYEKERDWKVRDKS